MTLNDFLSMGEVILEEVETYRKNLESYHEYLTVFEDHKSKAILLAATNLTLKNETQREGFITSKTLGFQEDVWMAEAKVRVSAEIIKTRQIILEALGRINPKDV